MGDIATMMAEIQRLSAVVQQQQTDIANANTQFVTLQQQQATAQNLVTDMLGKLTTSISDGFSAKGSGKSGESSFSLVDTRGISKPGVFNNRRDTWPSWSFRLGNFLEGAASGFSKILEWAADESHIIDDAIDGMDAKTIADHSGVDKDLIRSMSGQFYAALAQLTDGESLDIVRNVENTNGLEAWRLLAKEYDPAGSGRRRTVLSSIIHPGSFEIAELKSAIPRWETRVRVYNRKKASVGGSELDEDVLTNVLIDMCKGKLREHLELNVSRLTTYELAKSEISSYLDKKASEQVDKMDLSYAGKGGKQGLQCHNCNKTGHMKKDCFAPGGGREGQGGSSSSSNWNSGKAMGDGKGGHGGYQQPWSPSAKGKGKGGPFQGYCSICYRWGHKAADCYSKGKGKGDGKKGKFKGKSKGKGKKGLHELTQYGDWSGYDEYGYDWSDTSWQDDTSWNEWGTPETANLPSGQGGDEQQERDAQQMLGLDMCSLPTVGLETLARNHRYIEATVDSGAAKSASPPWLFSAFKAWRESWTLFKDASGKIVKSQGLAKVGVHTEDGKYHEMNVELANIHKLLLSVSALVKAGHEVHFTPEKCWIRMSSGEELILEEKGGVYTLKIWEANSFPVFPGRGEQ